jgi:hypothetical protein
MRRTHVPQLLAVTLLTLALTACSMTVNKVISDPSRYRHREITLSGEVKDSFSLMSRGVYRIVDPTGSLWVVSDQGVPRTGARIKVTGTIREGFNLGPLADRLPAGVGSGLVLVERSHRAREEEQ